MELPQGILGLPKELRLSILGLLAPADVRSLVATSKACHQTFEPALYSQITMAWNTKQKPPISLLLRSILERSDLASCTRSLSLTAGSSGYGFHPYRENIPPISVDGLPMNHAKDFIDNSGMREDARNTWKDKLEAGNVDALAALLISLLPNLESLHYGPSFAIETNTLGGMLRFSLCSPERLQESALPAFTRLRHVDVSSAMAKFTKFKNTANLLPFFYLPAVQQLSLSLDNPLDFKWPTIMPPNPELLTELTLFGTREQRLAPLLARLPHLQKLEWVRYYQPGLDTGVGGDVMELETLSAALSPLCKSLTRLSIEAIVECGWGDLELPNVPLRGSLRPLLSQCSKMMEIRIPWVFLMGYSPSRGENLLEGMPPSLERLTLNKDMCDQDSWNWDDRGRCRDYDSDDNEEPTTIAATVISAVENLDQSLLPSLQNVTLEWTPDMEERTAEQLGRLTAIRSNLNIDVQWVRSPYEC